MGLLRSAQFAALSAAGSAPERQTTNFAYMDVSDFDTALLPMPSHNPTQIHHRHIVRKMLYYCQIVRDKEVRDIALF